MCDVEIQPLAKGKLFSRDGVHHYRVFLWGGQAAYEQVVDARGENTRAMCITDTWVNDDGEATVFAELGQIHFVTGSWSVNTVAHEATHALLQRLRYLHPGPTRVLDEQSESYDAEDEEIIAYEMGDWVESLLNWLTNADPAAPYPKSLFAR